MHFKKCIMPCYSSSVTLKVKYVMLSAHEPNFAFIIFQGYSMGILERQGAFGGGSPGDEGGSSASRSDAVAAAY
jgi:hypothetical protein